MKRKTFLGIILGALAAMAVRLPQKAKDGCRVWTHEWSDDRRRCDSYMRIDGELVAYEVFDLNTGWQHNASKRNGKWSMRSTSIA